MASHNTTPVSLLRSPTRPPLDALTPTDAGELASVALRCVALHALHHQTRHDRASLQLFLYSNIAWRIFSKKTKKIQIYLYSICVHEFVLAS